MNEQIYEALMTYFNLLGNFGYVKDGELYKLITWIWLMEYRRFYADIMDEDTSKLIDEKIRCLEESTCIIPDMLDCTLNVYINVNPQ